jgi:hypothetical protein
VRVAGRGCFQLTVLLHVLAGERGLAELVADEAEVVFGLNVVGVERFRLLQRFFRSFQFSGLQIQISQSPQGSDMFGLQLQGALQVLDGFVRLGLTLGDEA